MGEWIQYRIGDIGNFSYGKMPKKDKLNSGNYPTFSGYKYQYTYPEFNCNKGDLIVVARGVGGTGDVKVIKEDCFLTNLSLKMDFDKNIVDNKFIYYYYAIETLRYLDSGSAQSQITINDLSDAFITLPPLEEQKAIAEVLSSLDDKIDLLHRQNKTLEELAQTLFRQWFKESDFNSTIGNIVNLQSGYAFKSKDFQDFGNNLVIKIKNISNSIVNISESDFIDDNVAIRTDEKFKINSGDILFAMTGAEIGKMGIVPNTDKNLWLNQRVGMLREKFNGACFLAYLHLTSEFGYDYIINTASGSAQPNISATDIENCPFAELDKDEIEKYSKIISPMFEKIIFSLGQIKTLENMRDTLLPKLMSGEVKVNY
ncbi:restriction endonuclease subunit S [Sulfurospirillum sp. 1612]|uniref:restriction endonuclease subunit S n=1 Tax=Sulfurospirillum sp. 1612 TaxID=3094835 RepID=UPI002F93D9B6